MTIPDICLFSPQAQFLVQLFSTQKRVNRNKTDFATKQRKVRQNRFCNKKMLVCSCGEVCHVETFLHVTDFSTFLCITHFAPNLSCGELSLCDRFSSHFSCGDTSPHDNLSYAKISLVPDTSVTHFVLHSLFQYTDETKQCMPVQINTRAKFCPTISFLYAV